jgi:hypothetical protein
VAGLDLAQRAHLGTGQCQRSGIGYTALDNGFRDCENPGALQRICDRLGPGAVKSFFWRRQRRLPSPLTRDDLRAGYVHEPAFRQFEVSDTRVFARPAAGRAFFEQLIRDHLDVGRPEPVSLIFDKRVTARTPGTFRTKVITKGVDPQVNCYYRSSRIKQYFTEHRAPAHRNGGLRHPGLWYRSAGYRRELECPSGGWRSRQPASV